MKQNIYFNDLGEIRYSKAWNEQKRLFNQVLDFKKANQELPLCEQTENNHYFLICEHPHVYTLGKSGSVNNLLVNDKMLKDRNIEFFNTDRGGDITYHGPGQIVGYPILDLEKWPMGVKEYIFKIEEVIIRTLAHYQIEAGREKNATGVWLDPENEGKSRKICAIGVKASRFVTMHGFAFNINTDLSYFSMINPCGFIEKGVTSMEKELKKKVDYQQVKEKLLKNFETVFDASLQNLPHIL